MEKEKEAVQKNLITSILLSLKITKAKEEVKVETPVEEVNEWAEFKPAKKPKAKVDKPKQKRKNETKQTRSKKQLSK